MASQQTVRQSVKRSNPEMADRDIEQVFDPPAHLGRGLVRKRDGEQALWRYALDIDQPRGPVHQHARLATACPGDDQCRLGRGGDGFALRVV